MDIILTAVLSSLLTVCCWEFSRKRWPSWFVGATLKMPPHPDAARASVVPPAAQVEPARPAPKARAKQKAAPRAEAHPGSAPPRVNVPVSPFKKDWSLN